jgi:hypothetical protein
MPNLPLHPLFVAYKTNQHIHFVFASILFCSRVQTVRFKRNWLHRERRGKPFTHTFYRVNP